MQHDTGKTRLLSGQKGSWGNIIRTILSHSPGALGRASVAGKTSQLPASKLKFLTVPIQVLRDNRVGNADVSDSTLQGGTPPQVLRRVVRATQGEVFPGS